MPDDILQNIEDEPSEVIPNEGEEEQQKDMLDELEPDAVPSPEKTEQEKRREEIIRSEIRKVASGEKELDEVPKWCFDDVKTEVEEITKQRDDKRLTELEEKFSKKLERIEEITLKKDREEDRKTASAILDTFLENSGLDRDEFETEHKKEFLEKVKEEISSGSSRTKAVKLAIGELYASGVVPNAYDVSISERRSQGGRYLGGGDATKSIPSREMDEMNRELAKVGVEPASKETIQKMKEQNLL